MQEAVTSRPVLMPGGWPPDEHGRDECARVLLVCDGDFDRIFDEPALDIEAYAQHVARIPYFRAPDIKPLFFVTGALKQAGRLFGLHEHVFELTHVFNCASWVVCLEPNILREFLADAALWAAVEKVGRDVYVWRTAPGPMLVVSWSSSDFEIAVALASLDGLPESGLMATVGRTEPGTVMSLESLAQMSAKVQPQESGEQGKVRFRPNPRIRRSAG